MSTQRFLLDQFLTPKAKSDKAGEELVAWGSFHPSRFVNFTREVHDFPNLTVSINVGASAGRLEQLAGITNVSVGVVSGPNVARQIDVNQIVRTGIFREGTKVVYLGQAEHQHSVTGMLEGSQQGYFSGPTVFVNAEAVKLLGNVQQITMVEPVDAASLAQAAVKEKHSLIAQLRRLVDLPEGWDGENARRVSATTGSTAEQVIEQIILTNLTFLVIPTIRLGPLPEGAVRFECTYSNKELFLTVSGDIVEAQIWHPLDAVRSVGYWKTDVAGAREHLGWLVK